jgi:hypothetical protein
MHMLNAVSEVLTTNSENYIKFNVTASTQTTFQGLSKMFKTITLPTSIRGVILVGTSIGQGHKVVSQNFRLPQSLQTTGGVVT